MLFQVRALPNPLFTTPASAQAQHAHPLTIHLSPTSTANVIISSLIPPQSSSTPFAKISPDGEVIVAPKVRPRMSQNARTAGRSIASTGHRSTGARSGNTRSRSHQEHSGSSTVFLRGLAQSVCNDLLEDVKVDEDDNYSLNVWVDRDSFANKPLKGLEYVTVSVVRPAAIEPPLDPQQQQKLKDIEASNAGKPSPKIVAKLVALDDALDSRHAALSPALCAALDVEAMIGGLVKIEAAPQKLTGSEVESLKFYPFLTTQGQTEGFHFGGQSKEARQAAAENIKELYRSKARDDQGLLDGPLTDGLVLPRVGREGLAETFEGGIVRLGPRPIDGRASSKSIAKWCIGAEIKARIEVQEGIPNPLTTSRTSAIFPEAIPLKQQSMIGVEDSIDQLTSHLSHCSSVLLTGGLGAGKTSLAQLLGQLMRSRLLYHITYFSCHKLMTDEARIPTIKDALTRLFMTASWGTKLGGRALIILDDLDKLCPSETELQTSDNGRSRQISELLCCLVRQYCGTGSGVVILATAQAKEGLNNVIIGGHVVREIVPLKVPNKERRRKILQALMGRQRGAQQQTNGINGHSRNASQDSEGDQTAWMDGSQSSEAVDSVDQFYVGQDLDLLDCAGQTDGYMPRDLVLLVSRIKNEALIRSIDGEQDRTYDSGIVLTKHDFQKAVKGFIPASLRNVTLQSSKTTFDSIGGLHETRRILLETLQYPTTYAPIFAQCPLRLRSGLLLYGYPGCGKTLLASAVAGECGLNFISVKGPEILNKYIGASEKSVRDLFERAESAKPCVLFFDEFDSIAPKRGHDSTGVTDRVVNQLLTQMDGAEGLSGVYVLAATSRPDLIDPALLRPGRLDKALLCDMPSFDDRLDILRALSHKLSIADAIIKGYDHRKSLSEAAKRTAGYSGADLQAVIYNAHLEAIHDVLGDRGLDGQVAGKSNKEIKKSKRPSNLDILQFRFGNEDPSDLSTSKARQAAEYANIIAKLDAIKLAKRKEKQARRGTSEQSTRARTNGNVGKENSEQEIIIEWNHIEVSLAATRSSIGLDERTRLERIYKEFIVGRNGEMPSGQGPTDVGGRSSLM